MDSTNASQHLQDALQVRVAAAVQKSGISKKLKSELRFRLIESLQHEAASATVGLQHRDAGAFDTTSVQPVGLTEKALFSLVLEFLRSRGKLYSLSVLLPECGMAEADVLCHEEIVRALSLQGTRLFSKSGALLDMDDDDKRTSDFTLLECLLDALAASRNPICTTTSTQTDCEGVGQSLEAKLRACEDPHAASRERRSVEERMLQFQARCEARCRKEAEAEIARIRTIERERIALEEAAKSRADVQEVILKAERETREREQRLRAREEAALERLRAKETEVDRKAIEWRAEAQKILEDGSRRQQARARQVEVEEQRLGLHAQALERREREVAVRESRIDEQRASLKAEHEIKMQAFKTEVEGAVADDKQAVRRQELALEREAVLREREREKCEALAQKFASAEKNAEEKQRELRSMNERSAAQDRELLECKKQLGIMTEFGQQGQISADRLRSELSSLQREVESLRAQRQTMQEAEDLRQQAAAKNQISTEAHAKSLQQENFRLNADLERVRERFQACQVEREETEARVRSSLERTWEVERTNLQAEVDRHRQACSDTISGERALQEELRRVQEQSRIARREAEELRWRLAGEVEEAKRAQKLLEAERMAKPLSTPAPRAPPPAPVGINDWMSAVQKLEEDLLGRVEDQEFAVPPVDKSQWRRQRAVPSVGEARLLEETQRLNSAIDAFAQRSASPMRHWQTVGEEPFVPNIDADHAFGGYPSQSPFSGSAPLSAEVGDLAGVHAGAMLHGLPTALPRVHASQVVPMGQHVAQKPALQAPAAAAMPLDANSGYPITRSTTLALHPDKRNDDAVETLATPSAIGARLAGNEARPSQDPARPPAALAKGPDDAPIASSACNLLEASQGTERPPVASVASVAASAVEPPHQSSDSSPYVVSPSVAPSKAATVAPVEGPAENQGKPSQNAVNPPVVSAKAVVAAPLAKPVAKTIGNQVEPAQDVARPPVVLPKAVDAAPVVKPVAENVQDQGESLQNVVNPPVASAKAVVASPVATPVAKTMQDHGESLQDIVRPLVAAAKAVVASPVATPVAKTVHDHGESLQDVVSPRVASAEAAVAASGAASAPVAPAKAVAVAPVAKMSHSVSDGVVSPPVVLAKAVVAAPGAVVAPVALAKAVTVQPVAKMTHSVSGGVVNPPVVSVKAVVAVPGSASAPVASAKAVAVVPVAKAVQHLSAPPVASAVAVASAPIAKAAVAERSVCDDGSLVAKAPHAPPVVANTKTLDAMFADSADTSKVEEPSVDLAEAGQDQYQPGARPSVTTFQDGDDSSFNLDGSLRQIASASGVKPVGDMFQDSSDDEPRNMQASRPKPDSDVERHDAPAASPSNVAESEHISAVQSFRMDSFDTSPSALGAVDRSPPSQPALDQKHAVSAGSGSHHSSDISLPSLPMGETSAVDLRPPATSAQKSASSRSRSPSPLNSKAPASDVSQHKSPDGSQSLGFGSGDGQDKNSVGVHSFGDGSQSPGGGPERDLASLDGSQVSERSNAKSGKSKGGSGGANSPGEEVESAPHPDTKNDSIDDTGANVGDRLQKAIEERLAQARSSISSQAGPSYAAEVPVEEEEEDEEEEDLGVISAHGSLLNDDESDGWG